MSMFNQNITRSKIQQVADEIVKGFNPEKIILFGSYAWGEPEENSDVDLFVVKETNNTRFTSREINGSIFPRSFPIDIVVYRPETMQKKYASGDFFVKDILTKGKVLYEK